MSEVALYKKIADELRRRVRRGEFKVGEQLPGEHALSREFGISIGTVKRGMMELVREGVLRRKRGSGTYVADPNRTRTGAVAMYFGKWVNPFEDDILFHVCGGIAEACRQQGLNLLFHTAEDLDRASPVGYAEDLLKRLCDGVVCVGDVRREMLIEIADRLPVVCVAAWKLLGVAPSVVADEPGAVALATKHLASLGRRRIALAADSEPGYSSGDAIVGAYREALAGAGLPYDESLVSMRNRSVPAEHRYPDRDDGTFWIDRRILAGADALVAGSQSFGRHAMALADELGRSVGDDLALVCVGDTHWTQMARPAVTAVDFLSEQIGAEAIRMLNDVIQSPVNRKLTRRVEPVLRVRESCGAAVVSGQGTGDRG